MLEPVSHQRYKIVDGKRQIEIRIRSVQQLFDSRDPAPFRERDLDDDFTEYITATADEFSQGTPLRIQILVEEPAPTEGLGVETITSAIRTHFQYQIDLKRIQLSKLFKTARLFLSIGVVCLLTCLALARLVEAQLLWKEGALAIREGFVIFGWVSLWKPFELILFDWYPVYDRIRLMRKLLNTEIAIRFDSKAAQ